MFLKLPTLVLQIMSHTKERAFVTVFVSNKFHFPCICEKPFSIMSLSSSLSVPMISVNSSLRRYTFWSRILSSKPFLKIDKAYTCISFAVCSLYSLVGKASYEYISGWFDLCACWQWEHLRVKVLWGYSWNQKSHLMNWTSDVLCSKGRLIFRVSSWILYLGMMLCTLSIVLPAIRYELSMSSVGPTTVLYQSHKHTFALIVPMLTQDNWPSVLFAMAGGVVLSLGNLCSQYAWAFVGISVTEVITSSITVVVGIVFLMQMTYKLIFSHDYFCKYIAWHELKFYIKSCPDCNRHNSKLLLGRQNQ